MIELHFVQRKEIWDLKATILPRGGLGIASEATLASLTRPSFNAAIAAVEPLSELSFVRNPDRWPVPEPKIEIINDESHADSKNFGNYKIEQKGRLLGNITNFPRGSAIELIKKVLRLLAANPKSDGFSP